MATKSQKSKKKVEEPENIIVVSGGFDKIGKKEVALLRKIKNKADWLIVGVNSDEYTKNATGTCTEPYTLRKHLISTIDYVDEIITFDDQDGTCCQLLEIVKSLYNGAKIYYIKKELIGYDITVNTEIPEKSVKDIILITMKDDLK